MWDVAIVGSGFGGALLALILRRLGRSVLLLERGQHPRFAIGESSTPLADLLWLELTTRYDLPSLQPFAKWGTWQRAHPGIACGLKRGFTFLQHQPGFAFTGHPRRTDQLLVGASPHDEISDTHWYRPEFDHHLVREAIAEGVEYRDGWEVNTVEFGGGRVTLGGRTAGGTERLQARFVVDASQREGPVARALGLPLLTLPHLPDTQGLFTHFSGVARLTDLPLARAFEGAPFPVDDAAVHHVFHGGWIWVLRFNNGITSAGVSARADVAQRLGLAEGAAGWERLLATLPSVAEQFAGARVERPFVHAPRLGFRTTPAAGPHWALLPSAAGFVDPLLSSGFTLTLLGIDRLARAFEAAGLEGNPDPEALAAHAADTEAELLALEHYVAALYHRFHDFPAFVEIARLYFTAVVQAETARRLGRGGPEGGFLLRRHPRFAPVATEICQAALEGAPVPELREWVDAAIRPFDVAGLSDEARRPWYPVVAADLLDHPERVGATRAEAENLLRAAGWSA